MTDRDEIFHLSLFLLTFLIFERPYNVKIKINHFKNLTCVSYVTKGHAKNQERHIANHHRAAYEELVNKKQELVKRKAEEQLHNPGKMKKSAVIRVKIDFETLQQGCLEMVTLGGRPFSVVSDVGFRKIVDPILEGLGGSQTINPHNISELVKEKAIALRKSIAAEVSGKLISIKADGGSRHGRSILGVNVQFIQSKRIQIRNLAMQELFTSHTSKNLKTHILEILRRYDLSVENVYTLTTDNAANMVKISKLMGEDTDQNADGVSFFDYEGENEVLPSMDGVFLGDCEDDLCVEGARCAPHTQQLAIEDVMKELNLKSTLLKTRELVKKLRTPTVAAHLQLIKQSKPLIDVETRWHSSLDMIESLLRLKNFCKEMEKMDQKFYIPEEEWNMLEDLYEALLPSRVATKIFQSEQLLPGDFYSAWMKCKIDTQKVSKRPDDFASKLVNSMTKREDSMFLKNAVVTSLYLDPRYNVVLSKEGVQKALKQVEKISKRLLNLKKEAYSSDHDDANLPSTAENYQEQEEEDEIEKLLIIKDAQRRIDPVKFDMKHLTQQLKEFSYVPRLPRKENLLEFWESRKWVWPQLYEVALVVHAHPVTQVQFVETSTSY